MTLIFKEELTALTESLEQIREELKQEFNVDRQYAENNPRPSALFEYFVLYNAALATKPREIIINRMSRGDFRAAVGLPMPSVKSHKTVWRMAHTIKLTITTKNGQPFGFWFDRALTTGLRPDIVIRPGHFEIEGEATSHITLLRNGEPFAEYADQPLDERPGYFVQTQKVDWPPISHICFRAKEEFAKPPLVIECKSFGAKLGNPEEYAQFAEKVIIVSPEKLYQPRRENIHLIKLREDLDNSTLREKLIPHLNMLRQ